MSNNTGSFEKMKNIYDAIQHVDTVLAGQYSDENCMLTDALQLCNEVELFKLPLGIQKEMVSKLRDGLAQMYAEEIKGINDYVFNDGKPSSNETAKESDKKASGRGQRTVLGV